MTAGVVTFANQMGANGGSIARAVAEKLRFRFYDWEVISQAAAEAGVSPEVIAVATSERAPTMIERMMRRLMTTSEAEEAVARPPGARLSMMTSDDYRHFIEHVVRELAQRGDAVIVGHSAQAILAQHAGVLKVLLTGSIERRVNRIATNQGIEAERARPIIEEWDRQRREFYRRAYHLEWLDAAAYDVVLNTDRLSLDLARDMIVACAREIP